MSRPEYVEPDRGDEPGLEPSAEDSDEDRLGVDPLEEGVEPPERWSEADRYGTTPAETRRGEGMARHLAAEQPEEKPEAEYAEDEATEQLTPEEPPPVRMESDQQRQGRSADEAGGSVAKSIREPDEPR